MYFYTFDSDRDKLDATPKDCNAGCWDITSSFTWLADGVGAVGSTITEVFTGSGTLERANGVPVAGGEVQRRRSFDHTTEEGDSDAEDS